MQLAGDSGPFFHDDQLLLLLLMAVQRQGAGQLFHQGIHQLLLIVAEMAANRQRRQQDAVLTMRIRQPPLQRCSAIRQRRQIAWTEVAAFIITVIIRVAGKLLVIIFVFQVVNPYLDIAQQRQPLQAIQYRRNTFAERGAGVQPAVGLP